MQPFPERMFEIGMLVAGAIGLLILIAPNFGLKPKATVDGWRFQVKPTCLLLYYLALTGGMGAVAFGARHLLTVSSLAWVGWTSFGAGFLLVLAVLSDWPEPLILDGQGLREAGCATSRIHWRELSHVRKYRVRCDRGVVIQGAEGRQMVVADIAYDSAAVLDCLLHWRPVPYYSLRDNVGTLSNLRDPHSRS